jgi:hypothetical protein
MFPAQLFPAQPVAALLGAPDAVALAARTSLRNSTAARAAAGLRQPGELGTPVVAVSSQEAGRAGGEAD